MNARRPTSPLLSLPILHCRFLFWGSVLRFSDALEGGERTTCRGQPSILQDLQRLSGCAFPTVWTGFGLQRHRLGRKSASELTEVDSRRWNQGGCSCSIRNARETESGAVCKSRQEGGGGCEVGERDRECLCRRRGYGNSEQVQGVSILIVDCSMHACTRVHARLSFLFTVTHLDGGRSRCCSESNVDVCERCVLLSLTLAVPNLRRGLRD